MIARPNVCCPLAAALLLFIPSSVLGRSLLLSYLPGGWLVGWLHMLYLSGQQSSPDMLTTFTDLTGSFPFTITKYCLFSSCPDGTMATQATTAKEPNQNRRLHGRKHRAHGYQTIPVSRRQDYHL